MFVNTQLIENDANNINFNWSVAKERYIVPKYVTAKNCDFSKDFLICWGQTANTNSVVVFAYSRMNFTAYRGDSNAYRI